VSFLRRLRPKRLVREGVRRVLWARETWDAARTVASEHGLSTFGVLRDQALLYRRYALDQYAYYWYGLYDPGMTAEEKSRYLPDSVEANPRLWNLLTPERYRCLYDNKLVFNRFFGSAGLPVARVLGVYDPRLGYTSDGRSLRTAAELEACLVETGGNGFVLKPVEGIQGHGILVFEGADPNSRGTFVTLAGERYDASSLVAFTEKTTAIVEHNPGANPLPFLLEERIRPHPALKSFLGPTLCSVRVQTIIARDGSPGIIAAVFKLQPGTAGVDQLIHGAVGCQVDLDAGTLGPGRTRSSRAPTSVIPGTDRSFLGFQLPDWPAAKELALRAAAAFPWARSIGWDIGLSDRGPILIEGNERWSPSLIQMPAGRGLLTGEFKALCEDLERNRSTEVRA
jgi:hypothetical protein